MNFFRSKGHIWIVLAVGVSSLIGAANASALPVSAKPTKPEVQLIRSTAKSSKGTVDVTVSFSMAGTNPKSPILQSQVTVGEKTCIANRKVAKCTVKAVVAGKTYKVLVRAKNRNGYSAWSSNISFVANSGASWMRSVTATPSSVTTTLSPITTTTSSVTTTPSSVTTTPSSVTTTPSPVTTTTLPAVRTDLLRANVLGISTVKLSKVGGISSSGVQSMSVNAYAADDVIFKTSGIVAYAQADTASQSGSKLLAVSTTGSVSDAISNGTAVIKDFYSAPNGNVYIVFESKVALTTGATTCLLAVVEVSTGVPTCVDSTLDSVNWNLGFPSSGGNSPIQIDASGAVYYAGAVGASAVLRKANNGVITDLMNDNVSLQDFIVLSDGTVLVAGNTNSSSVFWLRRISVVGGLKNLAVGSYVLSLWRFADGKVYAGLWNNDSGMKRYSVDLDALENKYWISGSNSFSDNGYFKINGPEGIPDCTVTTNSAFCGYFGTYVSPVFNILGQKTFGVAGPYNLNRQLWQYYPTVEKTNVTAINSVTLAQQVTGTTTIILSGTSSNGSNILSLYDTSSKQETVVMDGANEVEIYSMSYSQKKNAIMFAGLRFSDNKYVVGEVSLG